MSACTFFGHRECPETLKPYLRQILTELIANGGVETFYAGHQGQFDSLVRATLLELEQAYPHIRVGVVLYSMSGKLEEKTMLPEGIELVHLRYALDWRNRWLAK